MTAIAGYWSFDGLPGGQYCGRMLGSQSAYGKQAATTDTGELCLGRTLFSTLPEDLYDKAPQSGGGRFLAADVRLDNRPELIASLGLAAPEAATKPDSAILLECLLRWGESALDRIVGEFAFAFWHPAERRLLLARDITGVRPLFFHRGKHFFAFSSMPSGLHAIADIPYAFDSSFMAEQLALLPHQDDRSWFEGVKRVRPAHYLQVTQERIVEQCYWRPSPAQMRTKRADYAEGLRSVFDEAVAAQLRGSGDVLATQFSGGLDSGSVTATAARQLPGGKILAFTSVPPKGFDGAVPGSAVADESPAAAAVARLYPNVEHMLVENIGSPFEGLDTDFYYQQQPADNLCNAVWGRAINRAAAERGASVLLIGSAGNLTTSYAGLELLPLLLRRGKWGEWFKAVSMLHGNGLSPLKLGAQSIGPFLPSSIWQLMSRWRNHPTRLDQWSAVNPNLESELEGKAKRLGWDFEDRRHSDPDQIRLWALSRDDGGNYFKGVLGQWGLSVRDPTADRRVIEYCLSVPHHEFIKDGIPRSLARRAFADRLPPEVIDSPVRGYQAANWYESLGQDLGRATQEIEAVGRCPSASAALDVEWLKTAVATWPASGWERNDVMLRYRGGLLRGISAGHFMRKVAGTN